MKIRIRADSVEIEGYVNAVGRDSRRMTDEFGNQFVEQMQPGVFALALAKRSEPVLMLHNHDQNKVIGSTDEELDLEEDSIGLHARAVVTDPEVVQLAREGKLVGWSFGFHQLDAKTSYDYDNHVERSVVTEIELIEVSVIDDTMLPAYAGTSVHARAEEKGRIITRAMDRDVIRTIEEIQPEPEARAEEPEKPRETVDYTEYHKLIERLRRNEK